MGLLLRQLLTKQSPRGRDQEACQVQEQREWEISVAMQRVRQVEHSEWHGTRGGEVFLLPPCSPWQQSWAAGFERLSNHRVWS